MNVFVLFLHYFLFPLLLSGGKFESPVIFKALNVRVESWEMGEKEKERQEPKKGKTDKTRDQTGTWKVFEKPLEIFRLFFPFLPSAAAGNRAGYKFLLKLSPP